MLSSQPTNDYVLPVPFFHVLNGGAHSGNPMAFQEMIIAPVGAASMTHAVQIGAEVYSHLKEDLDRHGRLLYVKAAGWRLTRPGDATLEPGIRRVIAPAGHYR